MKALEDIAKALPLLENVDHYEHLKKAYELGGWVEVDAYIDMVINLVYLRGTKSPKTIQSTNKKLSFVRRLLNRKK
jgi:hypothetical protein